MKATVDFINDDPCHVCKYAVLVPDYLLEGPFSRRFGCQNLKRRSELVDKAQRLLANDTKPESIIIASRYLNAVKELDDYSVGRGFYKCCPEHCMTPSCFEAQDE